MAIVIKDLTRSLIDAAGSKHQETLILGTDKIYVPKSTSGKTINRARKKYLNQDHINKLAVSLVKGIDYSKRPPIVVKKHQWVDGTFYEYELICGSHRFAAMNKSNILSWVFDVYVLGTDGIAKDLAMVTLQMRENDHAWELPSTADDLINMIGFLIEQKLMENTEKAITDYLLENTQNLHGATRKKVVLSAVRKNGAHQDIRTFPSDDLQSFIDKNSDYSHGGQHDTDRDKFGWTILEGYEYEYISNALKKVADTDKGSYFLMHTKAPTENRDLKSRRKAMLAAIKQLESGIEKAAKIKAETGNWPWHIEAFMGQDVKNSEKSFLSVSEAV
mgnify:CR=1 FL=1|jgi:hypothetical protein